MAPQLGALRDALIDAGARSIETRLAVVMVMVAGLYAGGAWTVWLLIRIAAKIGVFA